MVIIDTKHSLNKEELTLLKNLIGQGISTIDSSGVNIYASSNLYLFDPTINLNLSKTRGYISISTEFDETCFGNDFNKILFEQTTEPKGIKTDNGVFQSFACLNVYPFTISKIEIFGYSYQIKSENSNPDPTWLVEKENRGQPIEENVETENILLFHSKEGKSLLMEPVGAVPWIKVKFDNQAIDPMQKNVNGEPITRLKRTIR